MDDFNKLSDEEFMNSFESIDEDIKDIAQEESKEQPEVDVEETTVEVEDTDTEESNDGTIETEIEKSEEEEEATDLDKDKAESETEEETEDTVEDTDKDEPDGEDSETDYEKDYKKVLSPFKANGKEMKVDNVEDVITLMKKGANYEHKMNVLKPQLKIIKALENNKLLDMEKISYLIDIHNKNPDAITKLLKDGDIDPLDLNTEEAEKYRPKDHSVSEQEYDLSETLSSLQGRQGFQEVIKTVTNEWDDASRQFVVENPSILEVLTEHKESGVFDAVMLKVSNEQILGRLKGINSSEAYKVTLDSMIAEGTVNQNSNAEETQPTKTKPKVVTKVSEATRAKKRKAAGVSKGNKTSSTKSSPEDDAKLSDEEFMKKYF